MLILAFDTSGIAGSVALLDDDRVVGEVTLDGQRRSAQTLAPAIDELLQRHLVRPAQLRLIAVTIGPGSFTGLRVGVTAAKSLAYAVNADVIAVSTLETIAQGIPCDLVGDSKAEIHAILDAQRNELFVGRFRSAGSATPESVNFERIAEDEIVPIERWLNGLPAGTLVTGPGLRKLADRLTAGIVAAPPERWEPRSSVVGRLAWRKYQSGHRDDLWTLAPVYLRPSYAEEKNGGSRESGVGSRGSRE
jgi:tRNA threonylcarbamoyladenosine biosynthesis protein TsaB